MCGIAGILSKKKYNNTTYNEILVDLKTRGEDKLLFHCEEKRENLFFWTFFHSRLSIIDPNERSSQPFIDNSGRYLLVFNGEIYNFQDLKLGLDYNFKTESDTEVLMALLIEKGIDCLKDIDGMFAFCFYDFDTEIALISRDRFGKKPLYFNKGNNSFCFSSKLSTFINFFNFKSVSLDQMAVYLKYQSVPGNKTLVNGVTELDPGSYLKLDKNGKIFENKKYFDFQNLLSKNGKIDYKSATSQVNKLIDLAVKKRLYSDVPFASLLSGGVDSSIISYVASKYLGEKLNTFTLSFREKEFDESKNAHDFSKKIGSTHHNILCPPDIILEYFYEFIQCMDSPSPDGFNTYIISKEVRKAGFKMALSGIGGDEWFLGYNYFNRLNKLNNLKYLGIVDNYKILKLLPYKLRKFFYILNKVRVFGSNGYSSQRILFDNYDIEKLIGIKNVESLRFSKENKMSNSLSSINEWQNYTQPILLKDSDQFSLANGVEMRNPFMDNELVDFVLTISDQSKLNMYSKKLLYKSFRNEIPNEIFNRPKKGFTLPFEKWMKNEIFELCNENIISFSDRVENNMILKEWIHFQKNSSSYSYMNFWIIVSLENWLKKNNITLNSN